MSNPECEQTMEQEAAWVQPTVASPGTQVSWRERGSAAVDGADPAGLAETLAACAAQADLAQAWREYQWVGDVLRHGDRANLAADTRFVQGVMAQLATEPLKPSSADGLIAPLPVTADAANDAVFRWKVVAGVAGLGVAAAVLWQVLVGAAALPAGAELAAAPSQAPTGLQVLVNTPQGTMVRDPELEALMAAHRQSGNLSALQRPAGFMRSAAFEAGQR